MSGLAEGSKKFLEDHPPDPIWFAQGHDRQHLDRLYGYAVHLYHTGCYAGAKEVLFFLIFLEKHNFNYHLAMGLCWQKMHRHCDAILSFGFASREQPHDARPVYFSGESFEALNEPELAQWAYENSISWAQADPKMEPLRRRAQEKLRRF